MSIGKRLLEIRQATGMSQAKFANKYGLSDRAYKNYELEIRELPLSTALKVSKQENISLTWLLKHQGAKTHIELSEAISSAITAFRAFCDPLPIRPSPEQEAAIVAFLVDMILDNGQLDSKATESYFKSVNIGNSA